MVKLKVKPKADVIDKWVTETPKRKDYYEKYATIAGDDWEAGAIAAEKAYKAGVTVTGIEKRFVGGIKRVGAAKYTRKVKAVGVERFGPGVEAAKPDYDVGVSPYLDELAVIDVPPRKPRGDPDNYRRVEAIGTALNRKRLAILAVIKS